MKSNCKNCNHKMEKIQVNVEGAKTKSFGYNCKNCNNLEFDKKSGLKIIEEFN